MKTTIKQIFHRVKWNRYVLFAGIVWRPVTGDHGDTWIQSWRKYRMSAKTAWQIACGVYSG
jgi:hypothetical protein